MIRKIVELDTKLIDQVAELVVKNDPYRRYCFPTCDDTKQIATALRKVTPDWYSVMHERVLAVFSIESNKIVKKLNHMCVESGAGELAVSEILSVLSVMEANSPLELGDV
jgi:hypothetical protein